MLSLRKAKPNLEGFKFILREYMQDSIVDNVEDIIKRYEQEKLDLWVCENHGFLLLYIKEYKDSSRELVILCVQGLGMYNREGIATINELAKLEGCSTIVCYVKKHTIKRLLERIGFSMRFYDRNNEDWLMTKKVIGYEQFA